MLYVMIAAMNHPDDAHIIMLPPEVMYKIFKYLDGRSLVNCRSVSFRWKEIVDTIFPDKVWENFCIQDYNDYYKSVATKSTMSWFQIYKNITLWPDIMYSANEEVQFLLQADQSSVLKNVHIYKDMLVVVFSRLVKNFNIHDMSLISVQRGYFDDWIVNDYMIFVVYDSNLSRTNTCLYGKSSPTAGMVQENKLLIGHTPIYRIEENCCYAFSHAWELHVYCWQGKWTTKFLGRYYGPRSIKQIHVLSNMVVVLDSSNAMFRVDISGSRFVKLEAPHCESIVTYILNRNCDIVHSADWNQYFGKVLTPDEVSTRRLRSDSYDYGASVTGLGLDRVKMSCGQLSCALSHANMLIVGNLLGHVEIFSWDTLKHIGDSSHILERRWINLNELMPFDEDKAVRAIDVAESKNQHFIYVCTLNCVYKITYTHPNWTVSIAKSRCDN